MKEKREVQNASPARRAALDILVRVEKDRAFAGTLLANLDDAKLSREDRALAQELVLGVLRWRAYLDSLIELYSKRPIDRLDLPVVTSLRMGLYQLRFLSRVPSRAAVDESVNLVKIAGVKSASGFVNAILRRAIGSRNDTPAGGATGLARMAIELSHPEWMLARWRELLGEEQMRELAAANNRPAGVSFRVNTLHTTIKEALDSIPEINVRESAVCAGAFVMETGPAASLAKAAESGTIYIQDEASQLVSTLLEAKPGDRVLDLCAAPGSKTTHIAVLTGERCWLVASDLYPHRLRTIRAACERLGIKSVELVSIDGARPLPFVERTKFDRVLVDAPCSGTGTLRANPEIKWRLGPQNLVELAELQSSLINNASEWVSVGGRLVYSTCSLEREENEDIVSRFLEGSPAFKVVTPTAPPSLITGEGFVRTYPHKQGCDGFFAAVFERTTE